MQTTDKIYIAGHRGLVGSAVVRSLTAMGAENLLLATSRELDLRNQNATRNFFEKHRPQYVFLAAATVGGILANDSKPADFIYNNLQIQTNVTHAAYKSGVKKLLFLGSSCIYPKFAPQPMPESCLLTGALEPTNQWYAIAKIAGIKMCQAYRLQYGFDAISIMPTNLYGPGDNFNLQTSHVIPALIRKFHEAGIKGEKTVTVWGTGKPRREFLHVDDLAAACIFLMQNYSGEEIVNIGVGKDTTIAELAKTVAKVTGFKGEIVFDTNKPDGTPQKLLDTGKLTALGFQPRIDLYTGLKNTYEWYKKNVE